MNLNFIYNMYFKYVRKSSSDFYSDSEYDNIKKLLLDSYSVNSLNQIFKYATENIPYYKLIDKKTFKELPILTKDIIRKEFDNLHKQILSKDAFINMSGGSTGQPVKIIQDDTYKKFIRYTLNYYYEEILNINYNSIKKYIIWGSEKDILVWYGDWKKKIKNYLENSKQINAFNINEQKIFNLVNDLNSFKPDYLSGYATSLYEIARIIKNKGLHLKFKPLVIVSNAETLQDFMRQEIENVFQAKVHDFYGSRETGALGGECKKGNYHFFNFNQWIDLVKDESEYYKILVTTLHNYSMPLLKYEIGDLCTKLEEKCSCGCSLPTVKKIIGRISDNFITSSGNIIHGEYFTHLLYFKENIKKFKIVQEDYEKICFYIETDELKELSKAEIKSINEAVKTVMGNNVNIYFFYQKIEPTQNGKYLFTLSKVYKRK
ncbi:MAG: phenylacetate--CoA ligase family protein [Candidatus Wallbacteria bacterium]